MISWSLLIGGLVYIIVGKVMDAITMKYLMELDSKVMAAYGDERYANMLWYSVPVTDTKLNRFLVNVIFTAFWPVICIASILKAEWNYDKVMRRSAFGRKAP